MSAKVLGGLGDNTVDLVTDSNDYLKGQVLQREFFDRPTAMVACDLLGKVLVHETRRGTISGKIVETEAYLGEKDPACHAYVGVTERTKIFYERQPGMVYVFSSFGVHHCMNVLTGGDHPSGCVLLRAIEPLSGLRIMRKNRQTTSHIELTNGPGKLTGAFGISKSCNRHLITDPPLVIVDCGFDTPVPSVSVRVGISKASHYPFRYFVADNQYVSRRGR